MLKLINAFPVKKLKLKITNHENYFRIYSRQLEATNWIITGTKSRYGIDDKSKFMFKTMIM